MVPTARIATQVYYIGIIDILMLCAPPILSSPHCTADATSALARACAHSHAHSECSHAKQTDARALTRSYKRTRAHSLIQTHARSLAYKRTHARTRAQTSPSCTVVCRYVLRKRIENTWKSMTEGSDDPDGVSAKPPREYSTPFHGYPEYHDKPTVFRVSAKPQREYSCSSLADELSGCNRVCRNRPGLAAYTGPAAEIVPEIE